mgnify:CR=1 FL=1
MSNLFNNPDNLVDMVRQILSGKPIEEKKEELDPVNKKAVKKKFDDRKDKDIDNDGDVDSTDKYLHKRRKAISKEINEGEGDQPCPHCKAMINAAHCVKENKPCPECGGKINASHCEEVELDEVGGAAFGGTIDKIQKVVDDKQAMKIDGVMVDTFTASLIMKIFNRVNKQNQDKMRKMKVTQLAKAAYKVAGMKEEALDEAKDEDSDGEKMTAAQKKDMDGDGEKDKGEKKKKKKKDGEDDEPKADKVNTEPETDEVKTMMSEREMTDAEKAKLDKMKKKYEGGEMHKAMKAKYGDKADEVFYGKLTKMAMGESVEMNESKYNKDEIDKEIKRDPRIKGKEAKMIHRLLKGRTGKKEETDLGEDDQELDKISKELAGASKMHKGQSDRVKKIADTMKEAKDEEKDTNLIMQLRKAVSLRGNKVKFADGNSVMVSDKDAQKFMSMFSKLKKPAEKEMMMKSAAKSHKHFKMALAGRVEKPKSGGPDLPKLKSEK